MKEYERLSKMLYWYGNDEIVFVKCIDLHALIATVHILVVNFADNTALSDSIVAKEEQIRVFLLILLSHVFENRLPKIAFSLGAELGRLFV